MKTYRILFAVSVLSVLLCIPAIPEGPKAKFEPPAGKILLLIGQDTETIEQYIKAVGIVPAGFMTYTSIQNLDGLDSESSDYGCGTMFAGRLVSKYPETCLQIGLYEVDALKDICDGNYDANIDKLANWLKKINRPVFLRIGYEFDGPHNHYDPEDYKKAFRYLVTKLRAAGATNTAYVWHSYAGPASKNIAAWYPGDSYVDWIGISYFNSPEYYRSNAILFAKEHGKPLMAAETTPYGSGVTHGKVSWNLWFRNFFKFVEEDNVKAISYINSNWEEMPMWAGQGWGNARIQDNDFMLAAWREEIKKDKYLWRIKY
jgi:hypothetical protein